MLTFIAENFLILVNIWLVQFYTGNSSLFFYTRLISYFILGSNSLIVQIIFKLEYKITTWMVFFTVDIWQILPTPFETNVTDQVKPYKVWIWSASRLACYSCEIYLLLSCFNPNVLSLMFFDPYRTENQ